MLSSELTAVNQYFAHAKLQEHWGFGRLATRSRDESMEEMRHAEQAIERILYLEGVPNLQRLGAVRVGEAVPEQLRLDSISRWRPWPSIAGASSWPSASRTPAPACSSSASCGTRSATPTGSRPS